MSEPLADHLAPIAGGWSLWRLVSVRSAGFPIALLERLGSPVAASAVDALVAPGGEAPDRRRETLALCTSEDARISKGLRDLARHPRFVEAMTWQNRTAVETGLAPLLRQPEGASNSKTRAKELMVASYAQRYCGKNDDIGFFGPLGWASLVDAGPAVSLRCGPQLLARRDTYFEHWPIDELARALAEDPALRRHLPPRRHPTVRVDGGALVDGRLRRVDLPPAFARLLAACDGTRPAHQIAAELAADPSLELDGEDEVYDLLDQLVGKNLAFWTLEVATLRPHPEEELLRQLAAVDGPVAARARDVVGELNRARVQVANAAGRVEELGPRLADVDRVFEQLSGGPAARRAGAFYAGRGLLYEDCLRDMDLRLGPLVTERLGPPLELVLQSGRWYTWNVARRYLAAFAAAHRALRDELGTSEVEYLRLWERIAPLLPNASQPSPIVAEVLAELRRRWAAILAIDPSERRVTRSAASLRQAIHDAFAAPGPGWPWARYHCPDVLISAGDADAAARGEFELVLGEVHSAVHTFRLPGEITWAPDRAAMLRAQEADIGGSVCVFPVTPRQHATHVDHISRLRRDVDVEIGDTRSPRDRDQVIAVADLVCEEVGGDLVIRTRDRRHSFHAAAFFGYYLSAEVVAHFRLFGDAPHAPRIAIDQVVIARERWTFPASDLAFCHGKENRQDRFVAARRWALAHGIPRLVFVKVAEEPKPIYIDLASPLFVELLARTVRKASTVHMSEMLPGPEGTWLSDADGNRYTSELRLAAVDPVAWSPSLREP